MRLRADQQDTDRSQTAEAWRGESSGAGLVFTGRCGTPVDPRTLNRRFAARCVAAGVRQLGVHDARKTCATLLVGLDVSPARDHARAAACRSRGDDGDLRQSQLRFDAGSAPLDAFLAGDDAAAKAQVATFLASIDLRPLDTGGLEMASVLEWTGILLMGLARNGAGFDIALGAEVR